MKTLVAAVFLTGMIAGGTAATAAPIAPLAGVGNADIIQVADGCGRGFFRDSYGRCRPMGGPRYGYAPGPAVVAPGIAIGPGGIAVGPGVGMRPRGCPPGYFMGRSGRCRPY